MSVCFVCLCACASHLDPLQQAALLGEQLGVLLDYVHVEIQQRLLLLEQAFYGGRVQQRHILLAAQRPLQELQARAQRYAE